MTTWWMLVKASITHFMSAYYPLYVVLLPTLCRLLDAQIIDFKGVGPTEKMKRKREKAFPLAFFLFFLPVFRSPVGECWPWPAEKHNQGEQTRKGDV
jgi:hypothetical protein